MTDVLNSDPRPERVRDWPKVSVSVEPALLAALAQAARGKGYSLSNALGVVLREVGLPYLRGMAPRQGRRPAQPEQAA